LTNCNFNFKIISLLMNPIRYFISHFRNIFFQFVLSNQGEFSVFPLFSFTIFLSKSNFLSLSLIDFNIWFRSFIFSELLEGGGLLSMTAKNFVSIFGKNIWIICDFYYWSKKSDNSQNIHIFRFCLIINIFTVFFHTIFDFAKSIIYQILKSCSYFQIFEWYNKWYWDWNSREVL